MEKQESVSKHGPCVRNVNRGLNEIEEGHVIHAGGVCKLWTEWTGMAVGSDVPRPRSVRGRSKEVIGRRWCRSVNQVEAGAQKSWRSCNNSLQVLPNEWNIEGGHRANWKVSHIERWTGKTLQSTRELGFILQNIELSRTLLILTWVKWVSE